MTTKFTKIPILTKIFIFEVQEESELEYKILKYYFHKTGTEKLQYNINNIKNNKSQNNFFSRIPVVRADDHCGIVRRVTGCRGRLTNGTE